MSDESVIEEAAKAMWEIKYGDVPPDVISDGTEIMQMARAAFAVFDKAHTPAGRDHDPRQRAEYLAASRAEVAFGNGHA